jgi:hypothetical protein
VNKRPEHDDKEQSAWFIETVEQIGLVDEPVKAFEEIPKRIVKPERHCLPASRIY